MRLQAACTQTRTVVQLPKLFMFARPWLALGGSGSSSVAGYALFFFGGLAVLCAAGDVRTLLAWWDFRESTPYPASLVHVL